MPGEAEVIEHAWGNDLGIRTTGGLEPGLVGVGGLDTGQTVYSVFLFKLFFPTPSGVRVL